MNAWLEHTFVAPLHQEFFLKALLGGTLVAVVCAVVGCLVILRRMAFLGDALSHIMLAGVAGGYLVMKLAFGQEAHAGGMLVGALIASVLAVAMIGFVSRVSRIKEDTAIGVMYTGLFAAGAVLVTVYSSDIHIDLYHFIMGDVLGVADDDLRASAIASALVLSLVILFFRHFQVTSFDPVLAAALGLPVLLIDYALTTCVSLVVVSGISMVGLILVVGLMITPAATAYLLTDRLQRMMWLAAGFAASSVVGGLYLAYAIDSSGGAAIMLFCSLQFLVVLGIAPRYGLLAGWLRRRRMLPQELVEDILGLVLKAGARAVSPGELRDGLGHEPRATLRALKRLVQDGMLEARAEGYALTEQGTLQARRLQRAHRLWETYLSQVGTPEADLHGQAHKLEHLHEEASVDYLDHILGHPLKDPHGSEIPPDFVDTGSGQPVMVSLLRKDQGGTIVEVKPAATYTPLKKGEHIKLRPRNTATNRWVVERADGSVVELDHPAADGVLVQPDS